MYCPPAARRRVHQIWYVYLPNDAICSLAKLFRDIVAFVNNEILVEDLEDLPALEI